MIAAPTETGGARQAALLLHAMAPVDRAWVLDALPLARRELLQGLLAELEALGLPADPALVRNIQPRQAPCTDEAALHALSEADWRELGRTLDSEPLGFVVQWLGLADWPWRAALLEAMEPHRRRRVEAALATRTATPPALRVALIDAVAGRMRAQRATPSARRRWPVLKRWATR